MMTICTEEDLILLRNEFNEQIRLLTEKVQVLEDKLNSKNMVSVNQSEDKKKHHSPFKDALDFERYVDSTILAANIPNLDAKELDEFKNRKGTYYIRDVLNKYASQKDMKYLLSFKRGRGVKMIDVWVQDSRFKKIIDECLPQYIEGYLRDRYTNIDRLMTYKKNAAAMNLAKYSESSSNDECILSEFEFKQRLNQAISEYRKCDKYKSNFHSLRTLIKDVTASELTPEELKECCDAYYAENKRYPSRDTDAIAIVSKYALKFIEAFEEKVYKVS